MGQAFIKLVDSIPATSEDQETWVNVASIDTVAPGTDAGSSRVWTGYDTYWITWETPRAFLNRLIAVMEESS